jgi:hypothetical protein
MLSPFAFVTVMLLPAFFLWIGKRFDATLPLKTRSCPDRNQPVGLNAIPASTELKRKKASPLAEKQ